MNLLSTIFSLAFIINTSALPCRLDSIEWARLVGTVDFLLMQRAGRYTFQHKPVASAVHMRYFSEKSALISTRQELQAELIANRGRPGLAALASRRTAEEVDESLRQLTALSQTQSTEKRWMLLADGPLTTAKELGFKAQKLTDFQVRQIARCISTNTTISVLDLTGCQLTDDTGASLGRGLITNRTLSRMILRENPNLSIYTARAIVDALAEGSALVRLQLSPGCELAELIADEVTSLVDQLANLFMADALSNPHNTAIQRQVSVPPCVNIIVGGKFDTPLAVLVLALTREGSIVTELELDDQSLPNEAWCGLLRAAERSKTLKMLDIRGCSLSRSTGLALASAIQFATALRVVSIAGHIGAADEDVGDELGRALANSNISEFNCECHFEGEGLVKLARGLADAKRIEVTGDSLMQLSVDLFRCAPLQRVELVDARLEQPSIAVALLQSIQGNPSVNFLRVAHAVVSPEGQDALVQLLFGSRSIEVIDLSDAVVNEPLSLALLDALYAGRCNPAEDVEEGAACACSRYSVDPGGPGRAVVTRVSCMLYDMPDHLPDPVPQAMRVVCCSDIAPDELPDIRGNNLASLLLRVAKNEDVGGSLSWRKGTLRVEGRNPYEDKPRGGKSCSPDGVVALSRALLTNTSITTIDIPPDKLGKAAVSLADAVWNRSAPTDIAGNEVVRDMVRLRQNDPTLTKIEFKFIALDSQVVRAIAEWMPGCDALKEVLFEYTGLSSELKDLVMRAAGDRISVTVKGK